MVVSSLNGRYTGTGMTTDMRVASRKSSLYIAKTSSTCTCLSVRSHIVISINVLDNKSFLRSDRLFHLFLVSFTPFYISPSLITPLINSVLLFLSSHFLHLCFLQYHRLTLLLWFSASHTTHIQRVISFLGHSNPVSLAAVTIISWPKLTTSLFGLATYARLSKLWFAVTLLLLAFAHLHPWLEPGPTYPLSYLPITLPSYPYHRSFSSSLKNHFIKQLAYLPSFVHCSLKSLLSRNLLEQISSFPMTISYPTTNINALPVRAPAPSPNPTTTQYAFGLFLKHLDQRMYILKSYFHN